MLFSGPKCEWRCPRRDILPDQRWLLPQPGSSPRSGTPPRRVPSKSRTSWMVFSVRTLQTGSAPALCGFQKSRGLCQWVTSRGVQPNVTNPTVGAGPPLAGFGGQLSESPGAPSTPGKDTGSLKQSEAKKPRSACFLSSPRPSQEVTQQRAQAGCACWPTGL